MLRLAYRIFILIGFALAISPGRAAAQDNFDANKSPAQLFANDCSGCHKSPAGLVKSSGMFGVESFLREHYTASRQAAAAIAGYLRAVDAEQAAGPAKRKPEPRRKAEKPAKKDDAKSGDGKPAESAAEKKTEPKPESKAEAKPEAKPEPKPESKPAESKPAEPAKTEKSE